MSNNKRIRQSKSYREFLSSQFTYTGLREIKNPISCLNWAGHMKTCLMSYGNTKGADQPAHLRSLISTIVVRCLESMICILAISKVPASFCSWAGWFESFLVQNPRRHIFAWCASIILGSVHASHIMISHTGMFFTIQPTWNRVWCKANNIHCPGNYCYLSLFTRKTVFGVCDQVRLKPVCSATETS